MYLADRYLVKKTDFIHIFLETLFIYFWQTGRLGGRYFTASLFFRNPFKSRSALNQNKHLKTNPGIPNL